MTPDDLCENIRNIVFEILKRRYPETMPTKREGRTASGVNRPAVAIRDKEKFMFYNMTVDDDVEILCSVSPFTRDSIDDVANKYVYKNRRLDMKMIHLCIDYAISDILVELYGPIVDEFGLGVER